MSIVADRTYTPDDLLKLPDSESYELVDGQLLEREMSTWSTYVATQLAGTLRDFVNDHKLGWVLGEARRSSAFRTIPAWSAAQTAHSSGQGGFREEAQDSGHLRVAPDLAVEVVSPNDRSYEVDAKVEDYLEAGVTLIWVVNPESRTVQVHRAQGQSVILREHDELTCDDVLPGFHCAVAELFRLPSHVEKSNSERASGA